MKDDFSDYWPQKGDILFKSDPSSRHNSAIPYNGDDWYQYIASYKRSADILITHAIETGSGHDFVVLPAVFLYRQYLELQLKQLIRDGKALLDEPPHFEKTHDLSRLWTECRKIMAKILYEDTPEREPSEVRDDILTVEACIKQFAEIDPNSMAFRYPIGRTGEILLPDNVRMMNLKNVFTVMAKLENFLDGAATGISEYLNIKQEIDEYYSGYDNY